MYLETVTLGGTMVIGDDKLRLMRFNHRWMLSVSEMKYTRRYFYNGIIMTATFFISRIFLAPFFWRSALGMISTDVYQQR